ncbi:hypothetical protein K461DRAFT_282182 [Myriangium duriaei CBS 260.36]|uniref:Uncharacterized protein n=1 Tax=Myriangium duriaei CBS 260.36 TaxID=1168546 RepID=A0A9P4IVN8_9PEZI|nr:hypothetical protein K461DRAFT_282182 [Myriangium duriaei CBS 260.36]
MALKRKRSSQSLSPSSPSSTTTSTSHPELTVTHFYPPTKPHSPAFHDIKSHLSSRTLKRHRDNRPSESIVHGMYHPAGHDTTSDGH